MEQVDRTALSWWFPRIQAAGLPVPRTKIVRMPQDAQEDIWQAFDGKEGTGALQEFCTTLRASAADLGVPFFLRTDHTSGKHQWKRTCFVADPDNLIQHVFDLAEHSELEGGIIGLPWDAWVLREFLPTRPLGVCPHYGDMQVCREFRFFAAGVAGRVKCWHSYWSAEALEQGGAEGIDLDALAYLSPADQGILSHMAIRAAAACEGAWSVDFLETDRSWVLTDMAEAHKSWHWPDCPHAGGAR